MFFIKNKISSDILITSAGCQVSVFAALMFAVCINDFVSLFVEFFNDFVDFNIDFV